MATRWNNRRVLLRWLRQLLTLTLQKKYDALARALQVAIEQLEALTSKS